MRCKKCGGTGELPESGRMREERERVGVSLREVARRMGISAPYLSDLERGRRGMNMGLYQRFWRAMKGEYGESGS